MYPAQVLDFPELAMGERNITNHAGGGVEERVPNGLLAAGDFTLSVLSSPDNMVSLATDQAAKTQRVCFLKNPIHTYLFTGWIKSLKEESADATSPDSVKLTVVVTPVGTITLARA
jgi:hypothetical protein